MSETTFGAAIERAIRAAMAADPRIVIFGEDVSALRRDAYVRFGRHRVIDAPISESAMLGAAVGASMAGLRPLVEVMFVDFVGVALDQLLNHAAKVDAFTDGRWRAPMVVRAACGGGYGDGGQHEQALWGMLAGIPGLTVVVPSTPADAAGLMLSALAHDAPVVFLEHKLLSEQWRDFLGGAGRPDVDFDVPVAGAIGEVGDPPEPVPIGAAAVRREGADLVMMAVGVGVHRCLAAAETLAGEGISAAVLDLRTVSPLDTSAIVAAAGSAGRVLVVDEDYTRGGLSGEIAACLGEADVVAAYARVTTEGTIPYARALEAEALPNVPRILAAARCLVDRRRAGVVTG